MPRARRSAREHGHGGLRISTMEVCYELSHPAYVFDSVGATTLDPRSVSDIFLEWGAAGCGTSIEEQGEEIRGQHALGRIFGQRPSDTQRGWPARLPRRAPPQRNNF